MIVIFDCQRGAGERLPFFAFLARHKQRSNESGRDAAPQVTTTSPVVVAPVVTTAAPVATVATPAPIAVEEAPVTPAPEPMAQPQAPVVPAATSPAQFQLPAELADLDLCKLDDNDLTTLASDFGLDLEALRRNQRLLRMRQKAAGVSA